jgi:predicted HicB family RNase H-like nuclease
MKDTKYTVFIRISEESRRKLKYFAAKNGITIGQAVEQLLKKK